MCWAAASDDTRDPAAPALVRVFLGTSPGGCTVRDIEPMLGSVFLVAVVVVFVVVDVPGEVQ